MTIQEINYIWSILNAQIKYVLLSDINDLILSFVNVIFIFKRSNNKKRISVIE